MMSGTNEDYKNKVDLVVAYNELYEENTKLKQEKEELEKKMYLIIMELYSENIINANIEEMRNILEGLGEKK